MAMFCGKCPVFNFSVDQNAAGEQMQLNAKTLGILGDTQSLPSIGDQAFVSADGIIMMRKGKNFVRHHGHRPPVKYGRREASGQGNRRRAIDGARKNVRRDRAA